MLRRLSSNDARFKALFFHDGLNILVADTTRSSTETDSRNSAGKSSMVELIHFLLGGSGDKNSLAGTRSCAPQRSAFIWTGPAWPMASPSSGVPPTPTRYG